MLIVIPGVTDEVPKFYEAEAYDWLKAKAKEMVLCSGNQPLKHFLHQQHSQTLSLQPCIRDNPHNE